jgi:hypothetical protein
MKAIINRKKYDTECSEEIGSWNNEASSLDFGYCSEKLYRTKKGNYFLCGIGGASTEYASSSANGRCFYAGWKIFPFAVSDCLEWCERTKSVETLEKYFAEDIQDA